MKTKNYINTYIFFFNLQIENDFLYKIYMASKV